VKVGILGDLHFRDDTPSGRVETDYLAFQMGLASSIIEALKKEGCEAVLLPGDIINKRRSSNRVVKSVIRLIRDSGMQWFTTVGQHDVLGKASSTYREDSDIGLIEEALEGQLKVLIQGEAASFNGMTVRGFANEDQELADFLRGGDSAQAPRTKTYNVALLHAAVSDRDNGFTVHIDSVPANGYDLQVHGDIHTSFDPVEKDDCVFINAGILTWQNWFEASECRCAGYAIVDTDSGECVRKRRVHPKKDEVFYDAAVEAPEDSGAIDETLNAIMDARQAYGQIDDSKTLEEVFETVLKDTPEGEVAVLKAGFKTARELMKKVEEARSDSK